MTNPKYTRNAYLQAMAIPTDNTGATFNDGAFLVGASATLASGTFTDIAATIGTGQVVISGFEVITDSGDMTVEIFGDTTAFTGGTDLPAYNTNKNSTKLPNLTALVQDPTVSVIGDLQAPAFIIKGNNTTNTINGVLSPSPIIFKPLTNYLFRITHLDGNNRDVSILLTAFENIITGKTFG